MLAIGEERFTPRTTAGQFEFANAGKRRIELAVVYTHELCLGNRLLGRSEAGTARDGFLEARLGDLCEGAA